MALPNLLVLYKEKKRAPHIAAARFRVQGAKTQAGALIGGAEHQSGRGRGTRRSTACSGGGTWRGLSAHSGSHAPSYLVGRPLQ
jgi:hypothetical protein